MLFMDKNKNSVMLWKLDCFDTIIYTSLNYINILSFLSVTIYTTYYKSTIWLKETYDY